MRIARVLFVAFAVIVTLLIGAGTTHAQTSGWIERSVDRGVARLTLTRADSTFKVVHRQAAPQKRNWIQRHPVLFGTLVDRRRHGSG